MARVQNMRALLHQSVVLLQRIQIWISASKVSMTCTRRLSSQSEAEPKSVFQT